MPPLTVIEQELSVIQRLTTADPDWAETLTDEEKLKVMWDWSLWARPKQLAPEGDWRVWLILAGRGFGKTRSGAEWVRQQVVSNTSRRIALVGATAADVRDTMIEGEYPDAWDQLIFGLRIGNDPRLVATTTPRPTPLIRSLVERNDTAVTTGSTYENTANLAPAFVKEVLARYEGTRLGRQELHAEILDDVEGALWSRQMIEDCRVTTFPDLVRIVVGVDPAISNNADSAETGIVAVGCDSQGIGYVLDDKSLQGSPVEWANAAIALYHRSSADRIVVEANQGGDMVRHTLQTVESHIPIKSVHATRGKRTRAEPVSALYEQGKVKHVGAFPQLEDQMCSWTVNSQSPDRLDALVWAVTELLVGSKLPAAVIPFGDTRSSPWEIN